MPACRQCLSSPVYRFQMWASVAAGLSLVCGALAQTNPVPASTDPAIGPESFRRLVDENVNLRQEQARLTREATDLRRRNASLALQVQELERKQESLSSALAGMQSPEELRAELQRLRQSRDALSREVERIRAEASAASPTNGPAVTPAPAPGSDLYRKLERENAELRVQLGEAREAKQSEAREHQDASRRETQLQARSEELNAELLNARREIEQAAARERQLKLALVSVARKVRAYEAALRETPAKTAGPASSGVTNVIVPSRRNLEPSLLDAARKSIAAGRYGDAERLYLSGLSRDPKSAQMHYNLGVLYDDYLQNPRLAAAHYRKYLELNPSAPDASIVRSWLVELDVKAK